MSKIIVLLSLVGMVLAQRPGYAGSMPYGYPVMVSTTTAAPSTAAGSTGALGNRFGEAATTQRLPLEANGNFQLVYELMQLPIDQRPFWLLNWQALEENRNRPQTWQVKENDFLTPPTGRLYLSK